MIFTLKLNDHFKQRNCKVLKYNIKRLKKKKKTKNTILKKF